MEIKLLKNLIFERLAPQTKALGFSIRKSDDSFISLHSNGWFKYSLIFNKLSTYYQIVADMGIRNDEVENIFHKTSGFDKKYQRNTATIGGFIWHYLDSPDYRYEIDFNDESAIDTVSEKLYNDFINVALNYFQVNNTLERIDVLLNSIPNKPSIDCAYIPHRCQKGVISARLVSNPNYDMLKQIYFDTMQSYANGFFLQNFVDLMSYIDSHYPSSA